MAYREVTMFEVKEVLRLWIAGAAMKAIVRRLGIARNTVRRCIGAGKAEGLLPTSTATDLTDERMAAVMTRLAERPEHDRGPAWAACEAQRKFIEKRLQQGLRLTKVHRLLRRQGVEVSYPTLYRFAVAELRFGRLAPTIPVADCEPGEEVQLDTGWMTMLEPDWTGRRRRFRAWIFTPVHTRYRFVYPCLQETTQTAIEACEAAWKFFGGIFRVVIVDNAKAIVLRADPLHARLVDGFLEYMQARGFVVDTTRVRKPRDKARVERAVRDVRDDCFAGERLCTLEDARRRAETWCRTEYGMRRHTRTQRMPLEHFEEVEKPRLLPAPTERYDIPRWCDCKIGPDQHAAVAKALYSLPREHRGKKLRVRADSTTVRFYENGQLVKTHPRKPPGGKSTDSTDFPAAVAAYAQRDTAFLRRAATSSGNAVGAFADALLSGPLPWARMRQVFALLGLCRRFGDARVNEVCVRALDADMHDVHRLRRMLQLALPPPTALPPQPPGPPLPQARYARPPEQYAIPSLALRERNNLSQGGLS